MADVQEPLNALWRRREQLQRWKRSETYQETAEPKTGELVKVKFQDGCVFLAACSSGDKDEVKKLLARGADINTANIDGLTALHQACIDDNLEMVEFLVEVGADIDACDNEGWTPLHATASCDFLDIAKYLIEKGASVSAVNNDGELPIDIADSEEMEMLLFEEMERQGVDADGARQEEEELMLHDANQWLSSKNVNEVPHPKTGATALHVAAAKGYCKVMSILIEAGVNCDAKDHDGWTPLHAASHWGQEDACKILVENFCNMDEKNLVGQTAFDIAEPNLVPFLEEMKKTQASLKKDRDAKLQEKLVSRPPPLKRRSSVTRMSVDQKQNVILKNAEEERQQLEAMRQKRLDETDEKTNEEKSSSESATESSDSETEKQNKINQRGSIPLSTEKEGSSEKPKIQPEKHKEIEKIEETESHLPDKLPLQTPRIQDIAKSKELQQEADKENKKLTNKQTYKEKEQDMEKKEKEDPVKKDVLHKADRMDEVKHRENQEKDVSSEKTKIQPEKDKETAKIEEMKPPPDKISQTPKIQDIAKSKELQKESEKENKKLENKQTYKEKEQDIETKEKEEPVKKVEIRRKTEKTDEDVLQQRPVSLPGAGDQDNRKRSFELPKRDEERETERKAKARRARETRRSTQGVTKEDLEMAEKTLIAASKGSEPPNEDKSDKENVPEDYSAIRRRAWDDKKEEDKNNFRKSGLSESSSIKSEKDKDKDKKEEKEDPSQKSSAIRTRRKRENRRPTGTITLEDIQGNSEGGEKKKEEEKKEEDHISSSRLGSSRYSDPLGSSSLYDRSSTSYPSRADRPSSYSGYSRSYTSTSLPDKDTDYKKLYEEEKLENEKLKKEVKKLKQDLSEAKLEIEKSHIKNESSRSHEHSSDKRERRALERKLSELEEELKEMENLKADNQRLKEENGALIRVISKLSK